VYQQTDSCQIGGDGIGKIRQIDLLDYTHILFYQHIGSCYLRVYLKC
jgi:hypothetical protein